MDSTLLTPVTGTKSTRQSKHSLQNNHNKESREIELCIKSILNLLKQLTRELWQLSIINLQP